MILRSRILVVSLRIFVAITLIIATVLSPLALSFAPILVLLWYLYLWRWKMALVISLLTEYFIFFAINLLLAGFVGAFFSLLISLPVLLLVTARLEETAGTLGYRDSRYNRRPTDVCLTLILIAAVLLAVALLIGNLSLILASLAAMAYVVILTVVAWRGLTLRPVETVPVQQRMVAGSEAHLDIQLTVRTRVGGRLFIESPYEWLKVNPTVLPLTGNKLKTKVSLTPNLSGPSTIKLEAHVIDRWGLVQTRFELEPMQLYVIPRARYAAWLVERYMAGTRSGTLPLVPNVGIIKPIHGWRRGVEYYGSQLYQPGDSLKNIDWKHSLQHNELITKEFAEFLGRSAVILVNLVVSDAEEADKLAYKIITTALSLAQENIPAALAAYDHEEVKLTTGVIPPSRLLLTSLQVAREMVTLVNPTKYLNPPDVARLRGDIRRLRSVQSHAARALAQLLEIEYGNLSRDSGLHPVTRALSQVFARVDQQSNIVIISHRNHDAEALAFNTFSFTKKGNAVITV